MMQPELQPDDSQRSPLWANNTKLIAALGFFGLLIWVLSRFQYLLGPMLLAVIIPYLLHPVTVTIHSKCRIPWKWTVFIIYLVFLAVVIGLLVWGGVALVDQLSGLGEFIGKVVNNLPLFMDQITQNPIHLGPFQFNLDNAGVENLINELVRLISPVFNNLGSVIGSIAGGTAKTIGWLFFVLFVSFFILSESDNASPQEFLLHIPGYHYDLQRMSHELSNIWSSFLRGQLIIVLSAFAVYTILLGGLGVRYFYALAILAGCARFIPYLGAWITWIAFGLVAYFQGSNIFGLQPERFVIVVLAISMVTDFFLDNALTPRVMANSLKIHPAAVLVAALVAANLFGLIGVLLAAPVVASLKLIFQYGFCKMLDMDPWAGIQYVKIPPTLMKQFPFWGKIAEWFQKIYKKLLGKDKNNHEPRRRTKNRSNGGN